MVKLGVETDVVRNGEVWAQITKKGEVVEEVGKKYDFCVYLDKDKYLGKLLEKGGLRLFNSATSIEVCDDKMLTYLALCGKGFPLVQTIAAPLCYTKEAKPKEVFLKNVGQTLGFPLVVKKSFGSFGEGVKLARDMSELRKIAEEFLYEPHFFQKYEGSSKGRDVRVIVVGGKAVAAMERVAKGDEFRSNIELGGEGKKIVLQEEQRALAERLAKELSLDYCGVDLLQTDEGAKVCEVNSNAFFEGLEKTTGSNIEKAYAEHIVRTMKNNK